MNCRKEKMYEFVDEQSIKNRFYRMKNGNEMETLVQAMANKNIYIADGHHRLAVSYRLNLSYAPFYLTNMWSKGIVILPYHRIVRFKNRRKVEQILGSLRNYMAVERIPLASDGSIMAAMENVAKSPRLSCLMYSKDDPASFYMLKAYREIPIDESLHESMKKLKVNVIHNGVLKGTRQCTTMKKSPSRKRPTDR